MGYGRQSGKCPLVRSEITLVRSSLSPVQNSVVCLLPALSKAFGVMLKLGHLHRAGAFGASERLSGPHMSKLIGATSNSRLIFLKKPLE
jgi:hypothetical protein